MKIVLLKDRNVFPDRKKAGDTVEIQDEIAKRWISKGIARLPLDKNNKKKGK